METTRNKCQFFDLVRFNEIVDLAKTDPKQSLKLLDDYTKMYPNDFSGLTYNANLYIMFGEFDKAQMILDYLVDKMLDARYLIEHPEKRITLEKYVARCQLKIFLYQNRIRDAIALYNNNRQHFKGLNADLSFYMQKLQGRLELDKRDNNGYMFKQITEYREKDFIEHIQRHLAEYKGYDRQSGDPVFAVGFPIDEIIKEARKYIPSNRKLYTGYYENTYLFRYDGCGRERNETVDYFRVVTFDRSGEIFEMYPTKGYVDLKPNKEPVSLNYMRSVGQPGKPSGPVKQLSRSEKFIQRYGLQNK